MASIPTYPITAVTDRLSLDLAELKTLLGVSGSADDALLTLLLASAKEAADDFLQNPFYETDPENDYNYKDPAVELAIPSRVKLGVVEWVRVTYQVKCAPIAGVQSRTRGQRAVSRRPLNDALSEIEEAYWRPYRLQPGWGGPHP